MSTTGDESFDHSLPMQEPKGGLQTLSIIRPELGNSVINSSDIDCYLEENVIIAKEGTFCRFDELRVGADFKNDPSPLLDAAAYSAHTEAKTTVVYLSPTPLSLLGVTQALVDVFIAEIKEADAALRIQSFYLDSLEAATTQGQEQDHKSSEFINEQPLSDSKFAAVYIMNHLLRLPYEKKKPFLRIAVLSETSKLNMVVVNPHYKSSSMRHITGKDSRYWARVERDLASQLAGLAKEVSTLLVVDVPIKPVFRYPEMGVTVTTLVNHELANSSAVEGKSG